MTSFSTLSAILRAQLSDAFAEVACGSSRLANDLLERFPAYGSAKSDLASGFWHRDAERMLAEVQMAAQSIYEEVE